MNRPVPVAEAKSPPSSGLNVPTATDRPQSGSDCRAYSMSACQPTIPSADAAWWQVMLWNVTRQREAQKNNEWSCWTRMKKFDFPTCSFVFMLTQEATVVLWFNYLRLLIPISNTAVSWWTSHHKTTSLRANVWTSLPCWPRPSEFNRRIHFGPIKVRMASSFQTVNRCACRAAALGGSFSNCNHRKAASIHGPGRTHIR